MTISFVLQEVSGSLNRTLPPLNSSISGSPFSKPPLGATSSPLVNRIPLNQKEHGGSMSWKSMLKLTMIIVLPIAEAGLTKSMEDSGHSDESENEQDISKV
jgi:hypothetical protein